MNGPSGREGLSGRGEQAKILDPKELEWPSVASVEWIQISTYDGRIVDGNPEAFGGGKKIYSEKKTPVSTHADQYAYLKVSLNKMPKKGSKFYAGIYDPDHYDDGDLDKNGALAPNDNNCSAPVSFKIVLLSNLLAT